MKEQENIFKPHFTGFFFPFFIYFYLSFFQENTRLKTENEKLSRITEKLRFVANILQGVAKHARDSCNKMPTPEIPSSDMEQRNVPSTSHQSRVDQSPASTSGPTHDTSKMVAPPPPASWQKLNEAVFQPKFNFPFEGAHRMPVL